MAGRGDAMIKFGAEILGGYSLLDGFMIPYMNADGSVNWNKLNVMLQRIANAGADYVREFPYWPTSNMGWNENLTCLLYTSPSPRD